MQHYFYDTCALLNHSKMIFEQSKEKFYISNLTLKELENIKTSFNKDAEIKYKARRVAQELITYEDKYEVINYKQSYDEQLKQYDVLSDNMDSRIILTALATKDCIFVTDDLYCSQIAKSLNIPVKFLFTENDNYKGYTIITPKNEDEMAYTYKTIFDNPSEFNLKNHEYLLIKTDEGIVDKYILINNELERLTNFISFDSTQFGKVKARDAYQAIAMDSLKRNKITALRGPAGSGKSYLAMSYLFSQLEHGKIDRIVIFCNTVATNGSAKLGYYPGTKDEKLLDSQIGNFLTSKVGDRIQVEKYMDERQIVLLPMSDIRGFDTTGMNAGIYITEAQNMDIELMKLALQRIGEDSICILDGDDTTQVDLGIYAGSNNGLRRVSQVFRGEDIYGEVTLPNIYRSKIAEIAQKM